jgi:FixJ family two-component response regulator
VSIAYYLDRDPSPAESLRALIEPAGVEVVYLDSGLDFLRQFVRRPAQCIVSDVPLHGLSGLEVQRRLADLADRPPFLFVASVSEVEPAVTAMKQGAVDYLVKPMGPELIQDAVMRALDGDSAHARNHEDVAETESRIATLTPREKEVLDLVVAGKTSREIAYLLSLSKKTIDVHRKHILAKLDAGSVVDLVRKVMEVAFLPDRATHKC